MSVFLASIDGPDFSGKTTIANLLVEELRGRLKGWQAKRTEVPSHLVTGSFTTIIRNSSDRMSDRVFALIYAADHLHHSESFLENLRKKEGKFLVIQERSLLTSYIYQGLIGGTDMKWLRELNRFDRNIPDLQIIVRVPLETLLERMKVERGGYDRFEVPEHLRKQVTAYYALPKEMVEEFNVKYVDGNAEPKLVAERCLALIEKAVGGK